MKHDRFQQRQNQLSLQGRPLESGKIIRKFQHLFKKLILKLTCIFCSFSIIPFFTGFQIIRDFFWGGRGTEFFWEAIASSGLPQVRHWFLNSAENLGRMGRNLKSDE